MTKPEYTFGDLLQIYWTERTIDVDAWKQVIDYYRDRGLDWQAGVVENKLFELQNRKEQDNESTIVY